MISYVYNPFSGNMDAISTITPYSAKNGAADVYPGDTLVVTHPPVQNMGLLPLVFKFVASIGRTKVAFTMDWPEEYEQEVQGDIICFNSKMILKDNAPPVSEYYIDARDLYTTNNVKTSTDKNAGWVYSDFNGNATGAYDTCKAMSTLNSNDSLNFLAPEQFALPWSYKAFVNIAEGSLSLYKNGIIVGSVSKTPGLIYEAASFGVITPTEVFVCYGNGIWVRVDSGSGHIYTSTDAKTWVDRGTNTNLLNPKSLVFHNGKFILSKYASTTVIWTSSDGITWANNTLGTAGQYSLHIAGAYCFALPFYTAGTTYFTTNDGGTTWVSRTYPVSCIPGGVGFVNGYYIYVDSTGSNTLPARRSTDLISWENMPAVTSSAYTMAHQANNFFYMTDSLGFSLYVCTDGATFVTAKVTGVTMSLTSKRVLYLDGIFVLITSSMKYVGYSLDGINFDISWFDSNLYFATINFAISPEVLLLLTTNSTLTCLIKKDKTKWLPIAGQVSTGETHTIPAASVPSTMRYVATDGNGVWLCCSDTSTTIYRSTDNGITYEAVTTGFVYSNVYGIFYVAGYFLIVTNTRTNALRSTNGLTWSITSTGFPNINYTMVVKAGDYLFLLSSSISNTLYIYNPIGNTVTSKTIATQTYKCLATGKDKTIIQSLSANACIITHSLSTIDFSSPSTVFLNSATTYTFKAMAYGNGFFIRLCFGTNIALLSYEGFIVNDVITLPVSASWEYIIFADGFFIFAASTTTHIYATTDFKTFFRVPTPWGDAIGIYSIAYSNGVLVVLPRTASDVSIYRINLFTLSTAIELIANDLLSFKKNGASATIVGLSIKNLDSVPTSVPTGQAGTQLIQNPSYVTPRYFITDTWDVLFHKALSITGITITAETPSGSTIKALMSIDDGVSWGKPGNDSMSLDIVIGPDLRSLLNSNSVDISSFGPVLQSLTLSDQKIKFAIDLQTTDTTVTPSISDISFQFIQSGLYQQVQTGEGTEWNVYNITEDKTCFEYKGTQKATVFAHVLPLV